MMAYWHKVLPESRIVDIHYEQLTAEPDQEGARMLDICGLEWDDNVLRFYEQEHAVTTASPSSSAHLQELTKAPGEIRALYR